MGIHKAIDDVGKEAKSLLQRIFLEFDNASATKQIVLGASSGFITGLLSMRIGRNAALALGGGIILLQLANEKNYITVNWDEVNKKIDKIADTVEEQIVKERTSLLKNVKQFIRNNTALTSGFIGGFLIGLSS